MQVVNGQQEPGCCPGAGAGEAPGPWFGCEELHGDDLIAIQHAERP